jgi:hypothetical protein
MAPARRDFRERRQHEAALRDPGMRQYRICPVANEASQVQDVDVDLSRTIREGRRAPASPLDPLDRVEQALGGSRPANLDRGVPEPPLRRKPHRLGAVEGGNPADPGQARDLGDRPENLTAPVADVGAEAQERRPRGARVSTLLPPAARARPLRLPRTRLRLPLLPPRPPGPLPRTRWCFHRGWAP